MENCVFCKIVKGEISCYKIYENDYVLAFLDASEDVDGHTLVIPKIHCTNIFDCPENILCEVSKVIKLIANHYKNLGYTGVNVLNSNGEDAGQSVFHLHFHIFPRKNDDELNLWPKLTSAKHTLEENYKKFKI